MSDDWLYNTLDCGDNSCLYRNKSKPSGMRTNGGCKCFERDDGWTLRRKEKRFASQMFWEIRQLREEKEKLTNEVRKLLSTIVSIKTFARIASIEELREKLKNIELAQL